MFSASFLFPFQGYCCCVFPLVSKSGHLYPDMILNTILYFPFTFCSRYFLYISVELHRLSLQLAFQLLLNPMPESPFHQREAQSRPGHSGWFNLPARGIMEVLGTVHMLSSSDLYPNARATPRAKRKPSAALAKVAADGNLTKVKYGSPYQHASYIKKPADLLAECEGVLLMHCAGRITLIYPGHHAERCFAHIQNLATISQVVHSRSGEKTH